MHPRVTYWTGVWHPNREGLSKEVEYLRTRHGDRAPVVSFANRQAFGVDLRERVVRLAGHQVGLLHLLAASLERRGDVTHAFGAVSEWHLLRFLGRRPLLFTAALPGPPADQALYRKVSMFVAESTPIADALVAAGVSASRIEVVYPGVNLAGFSPVEPPASDRFRLLFASTPADAGEFGVRGILLMVEAARRAPDLEFVLLWRRWGDLPAARRAFQSLNPPPNVVFDERDVGDMPAEYARVHATICCYADGFGKSSPNSVVEGLASGRPAVVSAAVGLSDVVAAHGAGVITPLDPQALVDRIREVRDDHAAYCRRARALAESHFDSAVFGTRYDTLYERVASSR